MNFCSELHAAGFSMCAACDAVLERFQRITEERNVLFALICH